jgi:hypothetical protein
MKKKIILLYNWPSARTLYQLRDQGGGQEKGFIVPFSENEKAKNVLLYNLPPSVADW